MLDAVSTTLGFGCGLASSIPVTAMGAFAFEKNAGDNIDTRVQARGAGIITSGSAWAWLFSGSPFGRGIQAGTAVTTIFWSVVNGESLSENSCEAVNQLLGMGAGIATYSLITLALGYPVAGLVAGSVLARYVGTLYVENEPAIYNRFT